MSWATKLVPYMNKTHNEGGQSAPLKSFSHKRKRPRLGSFIALLFALSFVALAVSPAVMPAKADASWDEIALGAGIGGLAGAVAFDGPGGLRCDGPNRAGQ